MKRMFLILAVFALFAAACASTTVDEAPESLAPDEASAPSSSSPAPDEDTRDSSAPSSSSPDATTSSSAAKAPPEGPAAPDFTLALEPNGEFVLSQEVKPVYMVFWAEW